VSDKSLGMYFKVPGDIDIQVYPDQDTIHDQIEEAILDGATHLEVHIRVIRKETVQ
jgi:hypothetical protein